MDPLAGFPADTPLRATGNGSFTVELRDNWHVVNGPNGGYLAALLASAVTKVVADPARQLRSLTVHYLRPPVYAPALLEVITERTGRSATFLGARLVQDERPVCTAMAACSLGRPGLTLHQWPPPDVPPPERCADLAAARPGPPLPIHENWDIRLAAGGPLFAEVAEAELIWWIRPRQRAAIDASLLVAISDALPPPIFATSSQPMAVPTVDLSVHLRAELASLPAGGPTQPWLLTRFRTRFADGGFLEEDGAIWQADGTLLAHSRQLALAL